jgi:hypothetical protein
MTINKSAENKLKKLFGYFTHKKKALKIKIILYTHKQCSVDSNQELFWDTH